MTTTTETAARLCAGLSRRLCALWLLFLAVGCHRDAPSVDWRGTAPQHVRDDLYELIKNADSIVIDPHSAIAIDGSHTLHDHRVVRVSDRGILALLAANMANIVQLSAHPLSSSEAPAKVECTISIARDGYRDRRIYLLDDMGIAFYDEQHFRGKLISNWAYIIRNAIDMDRATIEPLSTERVRSG